MRKLGIFLVTGSLVLSPFTVNLNSLTRTSAEETEQQAGETTEIVTEEIEFTGEEEFEYVPEEIQVVEKLEEQIEEIQKNVETVERLDPTGSFSEVAEKIKELDISQVVADTLEEQAETYNLENTEVIVESLEDPDFAVEEATKEIIKEMEESGELVVGDNSVEEEFLLQEPTEGVDEGVVTDIKEVEEEADVEILEDAIEEESVEEDGTNVLLDSEIALNIVIDDGEKTEIKDISELAEEVVAMNEEEQNSFFKEHRTYAANAKYGFFLASQNIAIGNRKTNNAKFINFGTITAAGGWYKPTKYKIELVNKRKTSKDGSYSTHLTKTINDAKMRKSYYVESSISNTYYWKAYATFTGIFKDGSKDTDSTSTDRELINKKGVEYPYYKDKKSGKVMTEPSSLRWTKKYYPESWTSSKRDKYLDWYEDKYGKVNRGDIHVHHIRPRVYYGNNEKSNLIPLKKSFHTGTVNGWWASY